MAMDDGLKQRIVGIIVLIALAMIFVPMLFDTKTKNSYVEATQIPEAPQMPKLNALDNSNATEKAPPVETADSYQQQVWQHQDQAQEPNAFDEEEVDAEPKTSGLSANSSDTTSTVKPAVTMAEDGLPETWTLQVGMFSDKTNADVLRKQLTDKGYQAYVRELKDEKAGTTFKVFVGPDAERAHAEQVKKKLLSMQKELHISGVMLKPYQP